MFSEGFLQPLLAKNKTQNEIPKLICSDEAPISRFLKLKKTPFYKNINTIEFFLIQGKFGMREV